MGAVPNDDPLAAPPMLSATQRGFVAAASLLGDGVGALEGLSNADREACAGALAALMALPPAQRVAHAARLAGEVCSPIPEGVERIHAGWLRPLFSEEASAVIDAVSDGLPGAVREVAGLVIGGREDGALPAARHGGAGAPRAVTERPLLQDAGVVNALRHVIFARLAPVPAGTPVVTMESLARDGAEVLGTSLQGAPRVVIARAAAGVGEPWAAVLIEAAQRATDGRAEARALVAGLGAEQGGLNAVTAIGLAAWRARLRHESDDRVLAVAQQLPPALGRLLIRVRDHGPGAA
jgi:hypothetical protein